MLDSTDQEFWVGNYHMPCVFWCPPVMVIHSSLVAQKIQALAGGNTPYMLAGDFNIVPGSVPYALLTEGTLEQDPALTFPDEWRPTSKLVPMQSAYQVAHREEPVFTNYAFSGGAMTETFAETLDYVFFGKGQQSKTELQVVGADSMDEVCAHVRETEQSLPSLQEPSDHLELKVDFVIV